MNDQQRITTEYVDSEDRIRITGEFGGEASTVLWLSQRLLLRLLPHLLLWLEKQAGDGLTEEIEQQFAQEAATATLSPEAPVTRELDSKEWLVTAVDLSPGQDVLTMQFRDENIEAVALTMNANALRQWLGIVHTMWTIAEWPNGVWPQWMAKSQTHARNTNISIH